MAASLIPDVLLWLLAVSIVTACPPDCECEDKIADCNDIGNVTWSSFWKEMPITMKEVTIKNGQLNVLPRGPSGVTFLEMNTLRIQHSDVAFIEPYAFRHLPHLQHLHLDHNNLTWMNSSHLLPLHDLVTLNLSHNHLTHIQVETFANISLIETLDLSHNALTNFTSAVTFHDLPELQHLDLSHNALGYLHPSSFLNLTNLEFLSLSHNSLDSLHALTFSEIRPARAFLSHNPWDCHCGITWLVAELQANSTHVQDGDDIRCSEPPLLHNKTVASLPPDDLTCDLPEFHVTPGNLSVNYMHSTVLPCNASTGHRPGVSVYWLTPQGVVVHPDHQRWLPPHIHHYSQKLTFRGGPTYWEASVEALPNGSLRIHNFRNFFSGFYTCVAENPVGSVNVTVDVDIESNIHAVMEISTLCGYSLAMGWLIIGIIVGAIRLCAETYCACCKPEKSPVSEHPGTTPTGAGDKQVHPGDDPYWGYGDEQHPYDDIGYMYDYVLRYDDASARESPMKCVTPAEYNQGLDEEDEDYYAPPHLTDDIKELLVAARASLRIGMERGSEAVRHRATHMREASSRQMEQMRERAAHIKERASTIGTTIRQQGGALRESSSQAINTMRHSSSVYANRVKAGMAMGVSQVKNQVASMKELCGVDGGPGVQATVSVTSVQTDVDSQQSSEVIKKVTYV